MFFESEPQVAISTWEGLLAGVSANVIFQLVPEIEFELYRKIVECKGEEIIRFKAMSFFL